MKTKQRGGTLIGLILGIIIGLGAALAVAVYVTKVPVPFLTKTPKDTEAKEAERNKNWDPNSPLYGKNPANQTQTQPVTQQPVAPTAPPVATPTTPPTSGPATGVSTPPATPPVQDAKKPDGKASSADPLGDLANQKLKQSEAKAAAASGSDGFDYFVQAGAFRTQADADAQRAKLAMLGWEARVSEREQNGRTVFRVRVGPFGKRDDAEQLKRKLDGAGVDSALVRVQR
ncbi:SPOR domain-containing protein [Comamonas terrigena]|uniref:SPOR domain-containing protein n=1 Tax=Comamonas terrigena TaxID=32013 RepID=UPI00244B3EBC|nr:SPOR domain-containing protein [Comamonas terrigena]MDH1502376.1 SPOR domain-containing protein [Comamonas terrigena]